jgi:DNA repair protein RadC
MKYNVVNEVKMTYSRKGNSEKIITCSEDSESVFREHFDKDEIDYREAFFVMLLNNSNRVLGICEISKCGISSTVVDARMIFQAALLANTTQIILCHNHPSGNTSPSSPDISITEKISKGGKLLEIRVLDHIIITSDSYYSFADNGKI